MLSILLVEDDSILGEATCEALRRYYSVNYVQTIENAKLAMETETYDFVLLDLGLPDGSGLDLLRWMKGAQISSGVLIVTALGAVEHRIKGLDIGADDYLVKPIDLKELEARIRAVQRRGSAIDRSVITHGTLELGLSAKTLSRNGEPIRLSAREFSVLAILMQGKGRFFNRTDIEAKLYGWDSEPDSNSVEVHISSLRRKLGKEVIRTVRGIGYTLGEG